MTEVQLLVRYLNLKPVTGTNKKKKQKTLYVPCCVRDVSLCMQVYMKQLGFTGGGDWEGF